MLNCWPQCSTADPIYKIIYSFGDIWNKVSPGRCLYHSPVFMLISMVQIGNHNQHKLNTVMMTWTGNSKFFTIVQHCYIRSSCTGRGELRWIPSPDGKQYGTVRDRTGAVWIRASCSNMLHPETNTIFHQLIKTRNNFTFSFFFKKGAHRSIIYFNFLLSLYSFVNILLFFSALLPSCLQVIGLWYPTGINLHLHSFFHCFNLQISFSFNFLKKSL